MPSCKSLFYSSNKYFVFSKLLCYVGLTMEVYIDLLYHKRIKNTKAEFV